MFSIPAFQSLNPFLAIITAALLLASAFAAPTPDQTLLNAPLNGIKSAAEGVGNTSTGDCAGQKPLFDAAFKEATALAQNALRAIDQVKIGRDNWIAFSDETRISASLQALFGVKAGAFREPMAEWDKGRSESVMRLYRRIVEFGSNGDGAVRTSCNDECVDYAKSSAHTSGGSGTEQRMFCTDTFEGNQHLLSFTALKTDKDAIPPNTHIETFGNALPVTFLRNVARSVSQDPMMEKLNGPSKHTYSDCAFLARDRPEMAKGSADNYAYFALSMWLEEIDWANGFAQKRTGTDDDEEIKIMRTIESGRVEHTDAKVGEIYENEIEIDMEQTEKARDMIDAMTRTQLEYQATGLPKPRKHSEFEPVRRHEVAEP